MATKKPRFSSLKKKGFDILFLSHAEAILEQDFPQALEELEAVLENLSLPITEIIGSGGGETKFTQRLRRQLAERGWPKRGCKNFCVNGQLAGNCCTPMELQINDRHERTDRQPAG